MIERWVVTLATVGMLALGACSNDDDGGATDTGATTPDTTVDSTDSAAPDSAAPDSAAPETATPDSAVPDTTPDTAVDTTPVEDTAPVDTEPEPMDIGPDGIDPDSSPDADVGPEVVTWDAVQPIFATSCAPCHAGNSATAGSGGHAIGSPDPDVGYAASQLDAAIAKCSGLTKGECALLRIRDGSMPATGECREPVQPKCPDVDEQALIERWVNDGMQR